jgi:membrane-associated phospholipid phosphatase
MGMPVAPGIPRASDAGHAMDDRFARRRPRMLAMLGMWFLASATYPAVAALAAVLRPQPPTVWVSPLDGLVPWLPLSVAVYLSLGPFTLLAAWCADPASYRRLLRAALVAMTVAYAVFLAMPMTPAVGPLPDDATVRALYCALRRADQGYNSLPSLHVAYVGVVLACRPWPWWAWAWGAAIAIATLTTRQHVLVDVLGGALLAASAWAVAGMGRAQHGAPST